MVSGILFLSFGVSCLLDWFGKPFFTGIYARFLSFMAFSAIGIRVRLFVFALLALVSGYQCISVFGIMLCACCSSTSSLEIWSGFFWQVGYPVNSPTNLLGRKPHLVFCHKIYEITLSEVLATQMGVTEAQHKNQLIWIVQIWPIFASEQVDSAGTRVQLCFGLLVSCYSLLPYSRPAW